MQVDSIAAGGDGVARVDGLVVFLPRSAPGDEGVASATIGRSFARGRMTSLTRPSPMRVEPPCAHYTHDDCGGCQLQHLQYSAQLEAKHRIVTDAFQRIARREVQLPAVEPSPEAWRYRAKLTLALRARLPDEEIPDGALTPESSSWVAGLHPLDEPATVFPLVDCPITDERLIEVWRSVLGAGEFLPQADALRISARLTSEGAAVVVQGGDRWTTVNEFTTAVPEMSELWWAPDDELPQLLRGRPVDVGADEPGDDQDAEPGAAFTQVNPAVAESLRTYVLGIALSEAPQTAIDAYAGTGAYSLALAGAGVRVTAIERDRAAVEFVERRLPQSSTIVAASVETALADALPADLVIVNPPRGGLHASVTQMLASAHPSPARLIYVSCNPATLARDVARLPGWKVASVRAFDMFPQTAHVETVCELVPEER